MAGKIRPEMRPHVRVLLLAATVFCGTAALAAPASQRWITFTDEATNLIFEYPAGIFTEEQGDPTDALKQRTSDRAGRVFTTADGTAVLQFGTFPNLEDASIDTLRKLAIAASYSDAKIEYNRTTDNWYVVSGLRGNETFYERVQFSCKGKRIDIFALTYPVAQSALYDDIVDEIARRVRQILAKVRCPSPN